MARLSIVAWLSRLAAREHHGELDEVIFALRGEETVRAFEGAIG